MTYTDTFFLVLFILMFVAVRALNGMPRLKETLIIVFSCLIIASWGLFGLAVFLVVVVINYISACMMQRIGSGRSRLLLASTIVIDVGILVAFKYMSFIDVNLSEITSIKMPRFSLGIPIAISFYTFHIISYLVDLYAGRIVHTSFRKYLFYLSFFPHVIAGPIVRAWQLIPQIGVRRRIRTDMMMGLHLFVTGFFLKSVSADNIAHGIDNIWQGTASYVLTAGDHWLVSFLYYCQIYADFGGYSLMALGMARMLGYRLPPNFRSPMLGASLQEFWRRWHITLSRWLRDYVYFPLGGNRQGKLWTYFNISVTMLLGGLWHGAGWGFVIWGGMHGLGLVIERLLGRQHTRAFVGRWIYWWIVTQLWITLAWIFFRTSSFKEACSFIGRMFNFRSSQNFYVHMQLIWLLIFAIPPLLHHLAPVFLRHLGRRRLVPFLGITTGTMIILSVLLVSPTKVFIYFKF